MSRVWTRAIESKDTEKFVDWASQNVAKSSMDSDVLGYRQTVVLTAHDSDGPTLFMPVQLVAMLEGLAPKPNLTPLQAAQSLRALIEQVVFLARDMGLGEVYFMASDEEIARIAEHNKFEKVQLPMYRLKLDTLEANNESSVDESSN